MIIAFTGTPGSGKTYDAVRKILDNLKQGRVVYTNVEGMDNPLCLEMIKNFTGLNDYALFCRLRFFEPGQVESFWLHVEPGSLIVLDEVQNIFSARDWQTTKNVGFNAWASTHRHHGYDVVLITQHIARIDSAVRALVEWTYCYRKVNFFGSLVQQKYMCHAYGGEDVSGVPLSKSVKTYHSDVFLCYKSYVSSDVRELGIMRHANVLKHPVFYAIPLVFCLFLYMLFNSGILRGDLFGTDKLAAANAAKSAKMLSEFKQKQAKQTAKPSKPAASPAAYVPASPAAYVPVAAPRQDSLVLLDSARFQGSVLLLLGNSWLPMEQFPYKVVEKGHSFFAQVPEGSSLSPNFESKFVFSSNSK